MKVTLLSTSTDIDGFKPQNRNKQKGHLSWNLWSLCSCTSHIKHYAGSGQSIALSGQFLTCTIDRVGGEAQKKFYQSYCGHQPTW